jgi:16S rRNA (cytosine1402-N4)-methyltransferase
MACSIKGAEGTINGFLLDLGVSSRQLDDGCRGFSYRANSALDMRFGSQGASASEILHAAKEEELERILRNYGEEPFAKQIASRLVEVRRFSAINTTFDLRNIVEACVPAGMKFSSLSRVFQAFRIATNDELENLNSTLTDCPKIMAPGGRVAVISYHSLEDRIVKVFFKEHSTRKNKYRDDKLIVSNSVPIFKNLTPKPILPTEAEIALNPRARSAKLRIGEKV